MSITDFFNSAVDIQSLTRTKDEYGTWSEVATDVHTDLPCCIQPRRGREFLVRAKEESEITHVMYCGVVTMEPAWRVNQAGKLYDILDVRNVDLLDRFLTIDLREVIA